MHNGRKRNRRKTTILAAFTFSLISVVISTSAHAEERKPRKVAVILGGGRGYKESLVDTFNDQANQMVSTLLSKGYNVRGSFSTKVSEDGITSPNDEELWKLIEDPKLKTQLKESVLPFSADGFERTISTLEKEFAEDRFQSGDQIAIQISDHGAPRGKNERSHSIILPSKQVGPDGKMIEQQVSLDRLRSLVRKLDEKGVKVLLLDFSCFSGNSLEFYGKNVCVVSASNRYLPASVTDFGQAGSHFWKSFIESSKKRNPSIEELFLASRKANIFNPDSYMRNNIADQMEISTPAHLRVRKIWDPIFSADFVTTIDKDLTRREAVAPIVGCAQVGLTLPLDDVAVFGRLSKEIIQAEIGAKNISEYVDNLAKLARVADFISSTTKYSFGPRPKGDWYDSDLSPELHYYRCKEYYQPNGAPRRYSEILAAQEAELKSVKKLAPRDSYDKMENERRQSEIESQIPREKAYYSACTGAKNEKFMLNNHVALVEANARHLALIDVLSSLWSKIVPKEREIYQELYSTFSANSSTEPNPCRDFRF